MTLASILLSDFTLVAILAALVYATALSVWLLVCLWRDSRAFRALTLLGTSLALPYATRTLSAPAGFTLLWLALPFALGYLVGDFVGSFPRASRSNAQVDAAHAA